MREIFIVIRSVADDLTYTNSQACSSMEDAESLVKKEMDAMVDTICKNEECDASSIEKCQWGEDNGSKGFNLYLNESNSYYWHIRKHQLPEVQAAPEIDGDVKVCYISPDDASDIYFDAVDILHLDRAAIDAVVKRGLGTLMSIEDFVEMFNTEQISDLGYVFKY